LDLEPDSSKNSISTEIDAQVEKKLETNILGENTEGVASSTPFEVHFESFSYIFSYLIDNHHTFTNNTVTCVSMSIIYCFYSEFYFTSTNAITNLSVSPERVNSSILINQATGHSSIGGATTAGPSATQGGTTAGPSGSQGGTIPDPSGTQARAYRYILPTPASGTLGINPGHILSTPARYILPIPTNMAVRPSIPASVINTTFINNPLTNSPPINLAPIPNNVTIINPTITSVDPIVTSTGPENDITGDPISNPDTVQDKAYNSNMAKDLIEKLNNLYKGQVYHFRTITHYMNLPVYLDNLCLDIRSTFISPTSTFNPINYTDVQIKNQML